MLELFDFEVLQIGLDSVIFILTLYHGALPAAIDIGKTIRFQNI